MKRDLLVVLILTLIPFGSTFAQSNASSWYLPKKISDSNTVVRFEVDSTWHMVEGTTKSTSGEMKLKDVKDPSSVEVTVRIPVSAFDTDNSSRDKEMRAVMHADKFPDVVFEGQGLQKKCSPEITLKTGRCNDLIRGKLTISGTMLPVELPVVITSEMDKSFKVKGSLPLKWADYGVEDPSIFIAKLDPVVTVFFEIALLP